MEYKEYEKDISGECTQEEKVVEDIDSERLLPICHDIGYVPQPQKEHKTKKVKGCTDDLSQSRITSGKHG